MSEKRENTNKTRFSHLIIPCKGEGADEGFKTIVTKFKRKEAVFSV
jgi:hypothetical protein